MPRLLPTLGGRNRAASEHVAANDSVVNMDFSGLEAHVDAHSRDGAASAHALTDLELPLAGLGGARRVVIEAHGSCRQIGEGSRICATLWIGGRRVHLRKGPGNGVASLLRGAETIEVPEGDDRLEVTLMLFAQRDGAVADSAAAVVVDSLRLRAVELPAAHDGDTAQADRGALVQRLKALALNSAPRWTSGDGRSQRSGRPERSGPRPPLAWAAR